MAALSLVFYLSLMYTQANTQTHTHLSIFYAWTFQIFFGFFAFSLYLPFSICRHKTKCSLCCVFVVVRVSVAPYHSIFSQIQAQQYHFYNRGKGQHSQINLICLFIVLLASAAWDDSTMAQWTFSDWTTLAEIQLYGFGLSEPSWICEKTHSEIYLIFKLNLEKSPAYTAPHRPFHKQYAP